VGSDDATLVGGGDATIGGVDVAALGPPEDDVAWHPAAMTMEANAIVTSCLVTRLLPSSHASLPNLRRERIGCPL
jgi:hypothetical protein